LANSSLWILIRSVRRGFFLIVLEGILRVYLPALWMVLTLMPSGFGILILN
jgi:hypothetical protein